MKEIFNKLNSPKIYLLLTNVFLAFFLILLSNLGILPIKNLGDFIFYTVIYFAFALYRPGWSFLFFVGTIALENINLAPKEVGIMIRPYQFIGALTILAVLTKSSVKRLGFNLPKWNRYDILFVFFALAGFLSAFGAMNKNAALKQSIIAASFVALYFLARIFIQNIGDLQRITPFFIGSGMMVVFYGLWQNFRFMRGLDSFEVMPGRPNATFSEPDWLGIFLVMLLAIFYALIYDQRISSPLEQGSKIRNYKLFYLHSCVTLIFSLVVITVSRSAWLGALAVTFAYLFLIWTNLKLNPKNWQWNFTFINKLGILAAFILGMAIVYSFNLTNFQIFNRARSTGTGLQKITVSCKQSMPLPEKINNVAELNQYDCRHINLEEINQEKSQGNFVTEIFRPDPNINIRSVIYQKSWEEIKKHPVFGIGWGNIGNVLGTDERGAQLNSSNIFLEVWLGSGILGLSAFVLIWIFVIINALKFFISNNPGDISFGLFLFLGSVALIIPNLFNAGIFIGILWLFLETANASSLK